jgi:hypothetical protein
MRPPEWLDRSPSESTEYERPMHMCCSFLVRLSVADCSVTSSQIIERRRGISSRASKSHWWVHSTDTDTNPLGSSLSSTPAKSSSKSAARTFLIVCALAACGGPRQATPQAVAPAVQEKRWVRGAPSPPPCSAATTRADCVRPSGPATCNPTTWMAEALGRLEQPPVACKSPSGHVLVVPGLRPATESELLDFQRRVIDQLRGIAGLRTVAVGMCCMASPDDRCLSLFMDPCGTPVDELFSKMADIARRDAQMSQRELRLRVGLTHPGPRCQPDDPGCGPVALGAPPDPDLDRYPIVGRSGIPAASAECSHDGECTTGSCEELACVSWRESARQWICPATRSLREPPKAPWACGCVAGSCRWFEQ